MLTTQPSSICCPSVVSLIILANSSMMSMVLSPPRRSRFLRRACHILAWSASPAFRARVQSYFLCSVGEPRLSSEPSSMSSWMSIQFWNSSRHAAVTRTSSSLPPKALQLVTQMYGRIPFPPRSG